MGARAYRILWASVQLLAHPDAMRKRVNVQVSQLKVLSHMQNSKGMIGLVSRIQVSLFVKVAQQILFVVHPRVAKLLHADL